MIKIILFIIFVALFIFIFSTWVGQSALNWIWGIVVGFYDNVLKYWNAEIYVLFALFMVIMLFWIIRH